MDAILDQETQANLDDLRERVLLRFSTPAAVIGGAWLLGLIWPDLLHDVTWPLWLGALSLTGLPLLAIALRRRLTTLPRLLTIAGLQIGPACLYAASHGPEGVYLLVIGIVAASVLLRPLATSLVTAITLALQGTLICVLRGETLLSSQVLYPVAVTLAVGGASMISARALYASLGWVWRGYEQAVRSERIARETSADLRQALRSLDEATYRLERTNRMLDLARDQAIQARQLKQRFAQNISHELRTPLNLIVEYSAMMAQSPEYYGSPLPPPYMRDLSIVHRNARHLQSMVSDVLDLARIEAAQVGLELAPADPGEIVRNAVETARGLIESKGLEVRLRIADDLPPLRLDRTRIRQVLFNLINNAVRFTDAGSVTVSARQRGDTVLFSVADTGVGIAADDLSRIFREFEQVDDGTNRSHGGVGLGLSISKGFVELHGGRIWAESRPGQGATLSFTLPIADSELSSTQLRTSDVSPSHTHHGEDLLLVVSPNRAGAALFSRHVQGVRTIVETSLQSAASRASELMPQAVLVDQSLVEEAEGDIESLAQGLGLEVPVMVVPLPGEERLRQVLAVDGYLIKPVTLPSLMDVLRPFGQSVDRIQVIDDDADFSRMLQRFLSTSIRKYQVRTASSGPEGLAMMRQRRPDLLLLDLGLPKMTGQQLVRLMRADEELARVPIVVISGQEQIDRLRALSGTFSVTRSQGLEVGHLVNWTQAVINTAISPIPHQQAVLTTATRD